MTLRKVKITKCSEVNTYAELGRASRLMLERGKETRDGSFYQSMASLIFSAFTLEAYLNHLGSQLFPYWNELERLSPRSKLSVLTKHLNIKMDNGRRPYQTVVSLFHFRDQMAHGKSEILSDVTVRTVDENNIPRERPQAKWEIYCTIASAETAEGDISKIIGILHKHAGLGDRHPLTQYGLSRYEVRTETDVPASHRR